ncbi:MAG: LURP-one-related family protein [Candidatus Omnitrophota bacterium]
MAENVFIIKKDVFTFLGAGFRILDASGRLLLYSRQKAFKLREDIRIYRDREMKEEALRVRARQIIDFSAAYDVYVSETNEKIGTLRRKGMKSILRDQWEILDQDDKLIASLKEDNLAMAMLRRFINIIPQNYVIESNAQKLITIDQFFNPFIHKFKVDFSQDREEVIDKRLAFAGVILLLAIEGRQQ